MSTITIRTVSITDLETDAVVNAANEALLAGTGVCGAEKRGPARSRRRALTRLQDLDQLDREVQLFSRHLVVGVKGDRQRVLRGDLDRHMPPVAIL